VVRASGGRFVECPVGGTTGPARQGKLFGFMGAEPGDAALARPILDQLCRRLEHVGPVGNGALAKFTINMPLMIYYQALGEALSMARDIGLPPERLMDILLAFPLLILALAIASILGPAVQNVVVAISIPIIPRAARVVRASALSVKENRYVEAAGSLGASGRRVVLQHIVPNVMAPYIIIVTAQLGSAILTEAALSYLGLGTAEPTPSWGLMLSGSASAYAEKAPWIALFPGMAISLAVFGFNLFGDSLRDALDPRLRRKG